MKSLASGLEALLAAPDVIGGERNVPWENGDVTVPNRHVRAEAFQVSGRRAAEVCHEVPRRLPVAGDDVIVQTMLVYDVDMG